MGSRTGGDRVESTEEIDYCARYGFDQDKINARLALLRLKAADHAWAEILQREVITPNVTAIIDAFYAQLLQHPQVSRILDKGFSLDHLKETQTAYMRTLGIGFDTPHYFNERLRIGSTHQRVGVPLSLYQPSFALLQEQMLAHIPDRRRATPAEVLGLSGFILRMTALDMSLAIETYHQVEVDALAQSIDSLRGEAKVLRRRAGTDALTGLANHSRILELLHQAIGLARHRHQPLGLIMADIDFFKQVNDQFGHLAGDEVLQSVVQRIRSAVQRSDWVGRYGGEEFLVILQNSDLAAGVQVADRIRRRIAESPIRTKNLAIPVTISLGVARLEADMDLYDLVARADQAMYAAKQAGRNRVAADGVATIHAVEGGEGGR